MMDKNSAPKVAVNGQFVKGASGNAKSALPEDVWEPDRDSLDQSRFLSFPSSIIVPENGSQFSESRDLSSPWSNHAG
jgi:hypothetical protein